MPDISGDRDRSTDSPKNPPQSVTNPQARRLAFWSYLGPIIALFVIIALAFGYWLVRQPGSDGNPDRYRPEIGTSGGAASDQGPSQNFEAGGGEPAPRPDSTEDELKRRGAGTTDLKER